ncbi:hypothetical protein EVAR_83284_1 [Eumeta japonica]|uniref:Uncharacterized protein n=1 Tax=Eumeta variegata TaxID=151549 RepID=A0A4C1XBP0_EUMVA|nr:hypothetical protein EVAR_83284_1 [Eumeta japonica]
MNLFSYLKSIDAFRRCADDQVILALSAYKLKMVTKMYDSVMKRGIKVNVSETKVMVFERGKSTAECEICKENERAEQAENKVNGVLFTASKSAVDYRQWSSITYSSVTVLTADEAEKTRKISAVAAGPLRSVCVCGMFLKGRQKNGDVGERCGLKGVTSVEKIHCDSFALWRG